MVRTLQLSIGYGENGGVGTVTKDITDFLNSTGSHSADVLSYWPWREDEGRQAFEFRRADGSVSHFDSLDEFLDAQGDEHYDVAHVHSHVFSEPYLEMAEDNTVGLSDLLDHYAVPSVLLTHSIVSRGDMVHSEPGSDAELSAQSEVMDTVDQIVHLSEDQRAIADRLHPEYTTKQQNVIGNGVHLPQEISADQVAQYRSELGGRDKKLGLYLGRFSREKGVVELAESLSQIVDQNPDFKLLIAGKGDFMEWKMRFRFNKAGLVEGEHYQFMGWVGPDKKQKLLQAADFTLLPSYWEHFPMAALESMASGTPVVMTDVEGPRSIFSLRDEHRLALPISKIKDPASIADAVSYALEHEDEMSNIAKRALAKTRGDFSLERVGNRWISLYQELIAPRNQSSGKVGVFVPLYNRADSIVDTVQSLLDQDHENYLVAIVDDGSIDGGLAQVRKKFADQIHSIEDTVSGEKRIVNPEGKLLLIQQENKGACGARNTAIKRLYDLGCDYFANHDAGDLAKSGKLSALVRTIDTQGVDIAHARADDVNEGTYDLRVAGGGSGYFNPIWRRAAEDKLDYSELEKRNVVHHNASMFSRPLIEELGINNLYWEGLTRAQDWDFFVKSYRSGASFGFTDETVASQVIHTGNSITHTAADKRNSRDLVEAAVNEEDLARKLSLYSNAIKRDTQQARDVINSDQALFDDHFRLKFRLRFKANYARRMGRAAESLAYQGAADKISFA